MTSHAAPLRHRLFTTFSIRNVRICRRIQLDVAGLVPQELSNPSQLHLGNFNASVILQITQPKELRHASRRPEALWIFGPVGNPVLTGFLSDVLQAGTNFAHLSGNHVRISRVLRQLLNSRFKPHVRTDPIVTIETIDFVAPEAPELLNQLPTLENFRGGRTVVWINTQLNHFVVTLQTG